MNLPGSPMQGIIEEIGASDLYRDSTKSQRDKIIGILDYANQYRKRLNNNIKSFGETEFNLMIKELLEHYNNENKTALRILLNPQFNLREEG